MTPDLLFTSLWGGGSPSSRETGPILGHLTCSLHHFGEAIRPVRERWCRSREARPLIYVTLGRRVAQFARDRAKVVAPDLLFTSPLRAGSLLLSASSLRPSAFAFSLKSFKFLNDQMTFFPERSLPCSSGGLLPPAPASRVAQFGRDKADIVTPDLLFTTLLRAVPPSSRETGPSP